MAPVLDGYTIGVTADRRADEQIAHFERWGAQVVHGPTIRTEPLVDGVELRDTTETVIRLRPGVVIANTGLGMRSWIGAAEAWGLGERLLDVLRSAVVVARGPKAASVLSGYGIGVAERAVSGRLAECVDLTRPHISGVATVAVQLDGGASTDVVDDLRSFGVDVVGVPVYRWRQASEQSAPMRLATAVVSGRVHAVTFTAAPAIRSWFEIVGPHGIADALRDRLRGGDVVVGCVGPVCAEAADEYGFGGGDVVLPKAARLGSLVRAVADRLSDKAVRLGDLSVTGTVVRRGDRRVELSDTEARIMAMLATAGGAVVSKEELLERVWTDPGGDPHLVEVTVGRLRRRLGVDGDVVVSVPRRGYALNIP